LFLVPLSGTSLQNGGETGEEVWSRLLVGAVESHVDEELFSFLSVPEVDGSTLVKDDDLVEEVIGGLGSLVDGDAGDGSVESETVLDRTAERDGGGGIESSSRVVPEHERSVTEGDFSDGDSLTPADKKGGWRSADASLT